MKNLRQKVYNVIREDDENTLSGTLFDSITIGFILITVLFVILDTFSMPDGFYRASHVVEVLSVVVFTAEYLVRVWTAPLMYPDKNPAAARLRFIVSFMGIIDLLSVLPFYLPFFLRIDLRILLSLRAVRMVRIFKIGRYSTTLSTILYVFKKKANQLIASTSIVFVLMLIASIMMYNLEHAVQPDKFKNAFSSFWWAVATVTTVGYGDMYPVTLPGKLLGILIALLGVMLIAVPTGIVSAGFLEASKQFEDPDDSDDNTPAQNTDGKKKYCPYCGKRLDLHD